MTRNWQCTGDISLEYGGAFIDLSNWKYGYAEAVRITDLESGCGYTGASMIEHVAICGLDDPGRLREAMHSCGCSAHGMKTKEAKGLWQKGTGPALSPMPQISCNG